LFTHKSLATCVLEHVEHGGGEPVQADTGVD